MNDNDVLYMRRALALARKADGRTSPNPLVGCVLVKAGKVIAGGWHKKCGDAHAEIDALKKAGSAARGADMYVTLEPCFHEGRTPPCVDAVIAAGIRTVVVAMRDPNPLTDGKSLRKLRKAGVVVRSGVCEDEARQINAPFIKFMTTRMPYVTAKIAQTVDGKIATRRGDSQWITASASREMAHRRRFSFDAILVGINTVLADDPRLNADGKALCKVVVDSVLRIPEKAVLFKDTKPTQVILATTDQADLSKIVRLRARGIDVIVCPKKGTRVDLKWLFRTLAGRGIQNILIEGGAGIIGGALKEALVDRLHIYIAPLLFGDEQARDSVVGLVTGRIARAQVLKFISVDRSAEDVFIEAEVVHVHGDR